MVLRIITPVVLSVLVVSACGPGDTGEEEERQGPHLEMVDELELIAENAGEVEATFAVRNAGDESLEVAFSHDESWLDFEPPELTVDPESQRDVVARGNCGAVDDSEFTASTGVTVDTHDERAGDHTLTVSLECEDVDTGDLEVTVLGLDIPELDEPDPEIVVAGINNDVERQITQPGTTTLEDLPIGDYVIAVDDVTEGPATFEGVDQTVTVEFDDVTETDVQYTVVRGTLHVDATGLADGVQFKADVDGPEFSESITGSTEFDDLYPGDYTVEFDVVLDDVPYDPDPEQIDVTLYSDESAEAIADYSVRPGNLHINVDIPDSTEVGLTVENTAGIEVHTFTTDSPTIETIDLDPGTYLITLDEPVEDQWDNAFQFQGIDEPFDVEDDEPYSHTVSTQLPTEVTTEDDDSDTYGSLREVVSRVNPGSVITFRESVQQIEVDEAIEIEKPLHILGNGDPEQTVITQSQDDVDQLLLIDVPGTFNGEVLIQQIRFADADGIDSPVAYLGDVDVTFFETEFVNLNAMSEEAGGALRVLKPEDDVEVRIEQSRFIDNTSMVFAGAVSIWNDNDIELSVAIVESTFEDNSVTMGIMGAALGGGAIGILGDAELSIRESLFSANEVPSEEENGVSGEGGGGAILTSSPVDISRTTFADNSAHTGGAIQFTDREASGTLSSAVRHSRFENNAAHDGGAIYALQDHALVRVQVDGVLFENNSSDEYGGAIYLDDTRVDLVNSTFSQNSAVAGGGMFLDEGASARLRYSTFIDNSASGGEAVYATADAYTPVLRANYFTDGLQAEGDNDFNSRGYNLLLNADAENQFKTTSDTDLFGASASYLPLSDNGGYTDTYAIEPGSDGYRDIPADDCRREEFVFDIIPPDSHQPLHTTDQRGAPRPSGARCTRGAWEPDAHFEAFEDAGFSDQFASSSFDGVDGRTWEYTDVRNEGDYGVPYGMQDNNADVGDLPGARFVDEGATISTAEFDGIDGDVESIAIVYRAAGGEPGERSLEVRADGEPVADSGVFGDDDDEFGFPPQIHVLEIDDVSDWSDFEFEIRNTSPDGEGDIVIDRINWR